MTDTTDSAAESGSVSQPLSHNATLNGATMDDNAAYEAAKNDPVASAVLDALHAR